MSSEPFSRKTRVSAILAVTIGNFLEWYEIYLYVYWTPILSKLFFNSDTSTGLIYSFMIFGVGFLARPLGGLFFGRLGDRIGRRKALILSILMMILPTFATGLMPTRAEWGIAAPILLALMRIFQSFPAGGELPGAFCYLYEISSTKHRRFMCSWSAVGYQLGILVSIVECYFLERWLSYDDLIQWGWRASFLVGGCLGFFGLLLRKWLHETPLFREMETHEKIVRTPLLNVISHYRGQILLGILFCALNSTAFYILSINFPAEAFADSLGLLPTIAVLLLITIPLPLFGMLGDRFDNRKLLIGSTLAMYLLAIFYHYVHSAGALGAILILYCLFFTLLSALIPYIVPDLFPTRVRFTCVGLSFNIADSVFGGFAPVAALYLTHCTGNTKSISWILAGAALLSLFAYLKVKPTSGQSGHTAPS